MSFSRSEVFLKSLADKTFLKLWTIPNTFYKPGKELTDLIIPFGNDIVIISDKASDFNEVRILEVAWQRWYKSAVHGSIKQLAGAVRTLQDSPELVFLDPSATVVAPFSFGPRGTKRLHLVGIARPMRDPDEIPDKWNGLTYVKGKHPQPFQIAQIETRGLFVHLFDGPTIDLLLRTLDTAPDFIAYLKGREGAMREADRYEFSECDLLASALQGWNAEGFGLPCVPPLTNLKSGAWQNYLLSETAQQSKANDKESYVVDQHIDHLYDEFTRGRVTGKNLSIEQHEKSMRLLASEGRFARRIIAHELHSILAEEDIKCFWASTVASPSTPLVRYVWLIYPKRPAGASVEAGDKFILQHLVDHLIVAQYLFEQFHVLGICLPNRAAEDNATYTVLHSRIVWGQKEIVKAKELHDQGIFGNIEAMNRIHIR